MTKPKNPYQEPYFGQLWKEGYAAGLHDGEARLARALRRYISIVRASDDHYFTGAEIKRWLTARQKSRREEKCPQCGKKNCKAAGHAEGDR